MNPYRYILPINSSRMKHYPFNGRKVEVEVVGCGVAGGWSWKLELDLELESGRYRCRPIHLSTYLQTSDERRATSDDRQSPSDDRCSVARLLIFLADLLGIKNCFETGK